MKKYTQSLAVSLAAAAGRHRWPARRPGLLILMYHRVLPRADYEAWDEQPGMVLDPDAFDRQLRWLSRHFEVVRLADWLRARAAGEPLPRKACALTFDDGWRDNFQHAFPLLQAHRLPATIYLVADYIGTSTWFWPNRVIRLLNLLARQPAEPARAQVRAWLAQSFANAGGWPLDTAQRDALIAALKARPDLELNDQLDRLEGLVAPAASRVLLDWDEVGEMAASGLVDFGSHTGRHVRLRAGLEPAVMAQEIVRSRELIAQRTGQPVETFCYPNGDVCPEAETLVRQHYQGAITTVKGWNAGDQDAFALRRIGIHQGSGAPLRRFLAQISGLL